MLPYVGAGGQALGPSPAIFLAHKKGIGLKWKQLDMNQHMYGRLGLQGEDYLAMPLSDPGESFLAGVHVFYGLLLVVLQSG